MPRSRSERTALRTALAGEGFIQAADVEDGADVIRYFQTSRGKMRGQCGELEAVEQDDVVA
jgi:hypothetical protein